MTRVRAALLAVVVGLVTVAVGYGAVGDDAGAVDRSTLGPGLVTVRVDLRYSRFRPATVRARPGTLVRFVVRNHDPIHHEFVVGPQSVHDRHAHGAESSHPPVPGEVSVGPNATGVTTYRFDEPGRVVYACHLPGHLAYGMVGEVVVG